MTGAQIEAPWMDGEWRQVTRCDPRARALADRHYSRQTPGAQEFMPNGRTLVMLTADGQAVWGAIENLDPAGYSRWRVSIFRREGGELASVLIAEATVRTYRYWWRRYGALPPGPLTTEVDPGKTRKKRDPGRCFRRAGWTTDGVLRRGLVVLRAPSERGAEEVSANLFRLRMSMSDGAGTGPEGVAS